MDLLSLRSNKSITKVGLAVVKGMLRAAHHFKLIKMQFKTTQSNTSNNQENKMQQKKRKNQHVTTGFTIHS